jgi:predicted N-acetyltransferase YhbS
MIFIRHERSTDVLAREAILDRAYGDGRFTKPSAALRAGRVPAQGLALVAIDRGQVVGTVRLWNVSAGRGRPALLLGPLAVDCPAQNRGIGGKLVERALREARRLGHGAVLLVGDAAYYDRFGFSGAKTAKLRMPGAILPAHLLGLELISGALDGALGAIRPTGDKLRTDLPDFVVAPRDARSGLAAAA